MAEIPKYDQYSPISLYQALNSIFADEHPEAFGALEREVMSRHSLSMVELEECYYLLDRKKWPNHAARLREQIEKRSGLVAREGVTEQNKYQTFWRRVGAAVIDAMIFAFPMFVIALVFRESLAGNPRFQSYLGEASQYLFLAYSIVLHAKYGQTLGKMAVDVQVVDVSEERSIGLKQAVLRDSVPLGFAVASSLYFVVFGKSYDATG